MFQVSQPQRGFSFKPPIHCHSITDSYPTFCLQTQEICNFCSSSSVLWASGAWWNFWPLEDLQWIQRWKTLGWSISLVIYFHLSFRNEALLSDISTAHIRSFSPPWVQGQLIHETLSAIWKLQGLQPIDLSRSLPKPILWPTLRKPEITMKKHEKIWKTHTSTYNCPCGSNLHITGRIHKHHSHPSTQYKLSKAHAILPCHRTAYQEPHRRPSPL